jgi:predicted RNA-binding protein with RPS1 domain
MHISEQTQDFVSVVKSHLKLLNIGINVHLKIIALLVGDFL